MIPKTDKLRKEESCATKTQGCAKVGACVRQQSKSQEKSDVHVIKPVAMLNEFVAVKLFEVKSDLALPDERRFKNEGIVIGVGSGVPDGSGGRCPSQLNIGDVVLFPEKNVLTHLSVSSYPYEDCKIAIMSERNLLCKLDSVTFKMVD